MWFPEANRQMILNLNKLRLWRYWRSFIQFPVTCSNLGGLDKTAPSMRAAYPLCLPYNASLANNFRCKWLRGVRTKRYRFCTGMPHHYLLFLLFPYSDHGDPDYPPPPPRGGGHWCTSSSQQTRLFWPTNISQYYTVACVSTLNRFALWLFSDAV
jgi:hypothetical protein